MVKSRRLGEEEAQWLGRILDAQSPTLRLSVPFKVAMRLLAQGLVRQDGPALFLTTQGIEVVVSYRMERA